MTVLQLTAHTSATGESVTVLQPTSVLQDRSVTVPLPTQYYKRVSDCSTAHTVLQESQ